MRLAQTISAVICIVALMSASVPSAQGITGIATDLNAYTVKSYVNRGFHLPPDQARRVLFEAVRSKDSDLVREVVQALAKMYARVHASENLPQIMNAHDVAGLTPLCYAAIYGNAEMASVLLKYGADPNGKDNYGNTPLMQAALNDRPRMMNLLIDYGARVNYKSSIRIDNFKILGGSALMAAVAGGSTESISQLIYLGADLEAQDDSGKTALTHAAMGGNVDVARLIIAAGANLNHRDHLGRTPLIFAVIHLHPTMVRLLLESGANVRITDVQRQGPLEYASSVGDPESQYLIRRALSQAQ